MSTGTVTIYDLKRSLLNDLSVIFSGNEAYSITRLILEHFGFSEISLLKKPDVIIDNILQAEIKKIVNELSKNSPIQYILGETIFFDLKFHVNKNVLIPRPETEELVSKILMENKMHDPIILDIGCGSGCISITLAHNIPKSKVYALDVDEQALETAKTNAIENNVNVEFIHKSIFEFEAEPENEVFDIIVSNPPYVTHEEEQFMSPNVTKYEPEKALFVPDNDPLIFYREIIRFAKTAIAARGIIWVEINEKFGNELKDLFHESGYTNVRLIKDIHGKDRFINASKNDV
jgi:release factor glutamine methyltransferase